MKKNILFIISFLAFYAANAQGWQWLNPKSQGNTLSRVKFVNTSIGYATSWGGTILKTINSGADWTIQSTGSTNKMNSICCIDANTVYAVGLSGKIIKTTNGGNDWVTQNSGTLYDLNSIFLSI